ncbi:Demethylsterigmatocystin 6-O-methyltransferase [Cytospora mali]|uniref:Demethylsterigmatocystin 6-O-methyltransferase n=1 Tax=Cytospora mali TaxID=578113 RepID=A0A194VWN5_CYTMA|nr:Demethylsterigmatocystin 6-O-methyltransferase [Valsa mali]
MARAYSPTDMDSLLDQFQTLALQADAAGRHKVLDFLRVLQLKLETPHDTLSRYSGLKGASPLLLSRILRYLASVGTIHETGPDSFTANAVTKTLSEPGYRGGIYHFFDNCGPVFQALPTFLVESKYKDITDAAHTAFQRAFPTDLPAFMWLPTQPERFGPLQQVMTVQGANSVPWFTVFPFDKELDGFELESLGKYALVDVGGGFGHQCAALLDAYPQLKNKLALQDLPQTLENLPPGVVIPVGIEKMSHDFFQEQPIKGARFYYLRNVMHDWPDDKCVDILKQLIAAFGPRSQILIDEMVLPDAGVSWEAATIDLTMMASLGSRERTLREWHGLLDQAGLKVLHIHTYVPRRQDSIIQAVSK